MSTATMSTATIADVISVARDMTITALDAGEPVAWLSRVCAPYHHYCGHLLAAVPLRLSPKEPVTGWVVRAQVQGGTGWMIVLPSKPSRATKHGSVAWSTQAVRASVLRGVAVVDPGTLPKQALQPVPPPDDKKKGKKGAATKKAASKRTARRARADDLSVEVTDSASAAAAARLLLQWFRHDIVIRGGVSQPVEELSVERIEASVDEGDSPVYFAAIFQHGNRRCGVVMPGISIRPRDRSLLTRWVAVTAVPTGNWANDLYRTRRAAYNTWDHSLHAAARALDGVTIERSTS